MVVGVQRELGEFDVVGVTDDTVQFYSRHTKLLKNSQVSKALKLVKYDCIKYIGIDEEFGSHYCFVCLPLNSDEEWRVPVRSSSLLLPDEDFTVDTGDNCVVYKKKPFPKHYNSSEYKMYKNGDVWVCNCQGYVTKEKRGEITDGVNCSHTLALMYAFRLKRFAKKKGVENYEEE